MVNGMVWACLTVPMAGGTMATGSTENATVAGSMCTWRALHVLPTFWASLCSLHCSCTDTLRLLLVWLRSHVLPPPPPPPPPPHPQLRFPSGEVYEGEFREGYRHGKGQLTSPNGDVYVCHSASSCVAHARGVKRMHDESDTHAVAPCAGTLGSGHGTSTTGRASSPKQTATVSWVRSRTVWSKAVVC